MNTSPAGSGSQARFKVILIRLAMTYLQSKTRVHDSVRLRIHLSSTAIRQRADVAPKDIVL